MRPARLKADEIIRALQDLPAWRHVVSGDAGSDALCREFRFADFNAAFAFMTRVAMMAERLDHHPDWSNVYNRVTINLSTHDAGGVTELDLRLAAFCDSASNVSLDPRASPKA
jgi:4a-hydroxytetrahydrobiopterin dehydratase